MQKGSGVAPNVGVLGRRPDGYTGDGADRVWLCGPSDLVSACRCFAFLAIRARVRCQYDRIGVLVKWEDMKRRCQVREKHILTRRLIGVCEILATCLAFVLLILFYCVFYSETYAYQLICGAWSMGIGIVCCAVALAFTFLLFGALKTENGPMMLVHAGAQVTISYQVIQSFYGSVKILIKRQIKISNKF